MQSIVGRAQRRNRCRRGAACVLVHAQARCRKENENQLDTSWPLCIRTYVRLRVCMLVTGKNVRYVGNVMSTSLLLYNFGSLHASDNPSLVAIREGF